MKGIILVVLIGFIASSSAFSQEKADAEKQLGELAAPGTRNHGTGFDNRVTLQAGDADAKATAKLSGLANLNTEHGKYLQYGLEVSAPFDSKKADKVDVGTLSGLSAGTNAKIEVGVLIWPKASSGEQTNVDDVCKAAIPQLIPGYTWNIVSALSPNVCEAALFKKEALDEIVKSIDEARTKCAKEDPKGSDTAVCYILRDAKPAKLTNKPDAILKQAAQDVTKAERKALKPISIITLGATSNRQKMKWVTSDDPTKSTEQNKTGAGVSLAFTRLNFDWLWSAGFSYEKSYKAGDKSQVCSPIGTTTSQQCSEVSIGAPKENKQNIAFAEGRWLIVPGKLAISPRLEFETKESEWAINLPIYFMPNQKSQLTGGVAVGYSDKDHFGATVFIGKSFTLSE